LNKINFKLYILIYFCLFSPISNQVLAQKVCPLAPNIDLERLTNLAREWDYMHDNMLAQLRAGDERTVFGTIVDEGCLRGLTPELHRARIAQLEQGLGSAIAQMHACGQALGFIETPDIISTLRRTRIRCGDLGQSGLGEMQIEFNCPATHLRMTATSTHRFEMTLAMPETKNGETTNGPNFETWNVTELGSVIAHEAMHVLAMNNRSWHNDLSSRAKTGCNNSIFYDRIYFTESACFPNVRSGQEFYSDNGPYQCPEVCEAALTEIDPSVVEDNLPAQSLDSATGVYGPSTVARPYPIAEARRICQRIRSHRGIFPDSTR